MSGRNRSGTLEWERTEDLGLRKERQSGALGCSGCCFVAVVPRAFRAGGTRLRSGPGAGASARLGLRLPLQHDGAFSS